MIVLVGISVLIFCLIHMQPGNPYSSMMSPHLDPEMVRNRLRELGYYDPMYIKYIKWITRAIKMDWGYSIKYSEPVMAVVSRRFLNTLILMIGPLVFSLVFGCTFGIICAVKKNTRMDDLISLVSFVGISIPSFFFSLLLIKKFSYDLGIFPSSGMYDVRSSGEGLAYMGDLIRHLVLPSLVLTLLQATAFVRYTRSSMIEVLDKEYILAAMAKGLTRRQAIIRHGFKNALIPIVTVFFLQLPGLFSGAIMTETVFVWPGIGRLGYEAVMNRDYPLVMGILMITSVFILLSNILADILYVVIDKRVMEDSI